MLFSDLNNPTRSDLDDNSFEENIPDEDLLPDETLQKLEEKTADEKFLNDLLAKLRPIYQEILALHYQEEMTFNEISEATGKPMNTVKSWHRRALFKLRDKLGEMHR